MLKLCTKYDRRLCELNQTISVVPPKSDNCVGTTVDHAIEMVSFDSFKRGMQTHQYQQAYFMMATSTTKNAELNFTHRHAHGQ